MYQKKTSLWQNSQFNCRVLILPKGNRWSWGFFHTVRRSLPLFFQSPLYMWDVFATGEYSSECVVGGRKICWFASKASLELWATTRSNHDITPGETLCVMVWMLDSNITNLREEESIHVYSCTNQYIYITNRSNDWVIWKGSLGVKKTSLSSTSLWFNPCSHQISFQQQQTDVFNAHYLSRHK